MRGRREERRAVSPQHWTGIVKSLDVSLWGRQRQDWSIMSGRSMAAWGVVQKCPFCDQPFEKQGLTMYSSYCEANLNRKKSRTR